MKAFPTLVVFALCCVAVGFLTQGCDGDDGDGDSTVVTNTVTVTNTPTPAASATGTWNGQFGTSVPFTMTLVQNGSALTGSYSSQGNPGSVSGDTSGGNIGMTVNVDTGSTNVIAEWNGNINADMNSANGSFNIIQGGGGNGSWSMTQ